MATVDPEREIPPAEPDPATTSDGPSSPEPHPQEDAEDGED